MMDALLLAVRDIIRDVGYGYDQATCEICAPPGQPPARAGPIFVAVVEGSVSSEMDNALDEYYAYSLVLTQRVQVPLDRVGDKLLASSLARNPVPGGQPSFNARLEQLRALLHMNWEVIGRANNFLAPTEQQAGHAVSGFAEPARYLGGLDDLRLEGGSWFWADAEARDVGLVASLRFGRARRLQPLATFI